jgi:hypothetical protein
MGCGVTILKKILVLTFDDNYLKVVSHMITDKEFEINENTNFINFKYRQKNILFTFLSNRQKWTWLHHFSGTYGIIIIYEGNDVRNNINEIENILNSNVLNKRPLILIFDKSSLEDKDYTVLEKIRFNLYKRNIKFIIQFIDFSNNNKNLELYYGLEWLFHEINTK